MCLLNGSGEDALVESAARAVRDGFTAVKMTTFPIGWPEKRYPNLIRECTGIVAAIRETVGWNVDIGVEIHRNMVPSQAVIFAQQIENFLPYFYEDPILPENFDAMGLVAQHINIPIATGERLHTIHEFEMLLKRGAVQYVRPDVCMVGGITHAKKIAAIAEAHYVGVVPHNPLSPVSTAACLQIAAAIPNFALQEYPIGEGEAPKTEIVKSAVRQENGYLIVPDAPGIGVELADDAAEKHPFTPRVVSTRLHEDGSVIDQ